MCKPLAVLIAGILIAISSMTVSLRAGEAGKVEPLGDNAELTPPPPPWVPDAQNPQLKAYTWDMADQSRGWVIVYPTQKFDPTDKTAEEVKKYADQLQQSGRSVDAPTIALDDPRFLAKLHYHTRYSGGSDKQLDTVMLFRKSGDLLVKVDSTVDAPGGAGGAGGETAMAAVHKLAEDVALAVSPKGATPAGTTVAFDAKPIMALFKKPGQVGVGDRPKLASVNAFDNRNFTLADYKGKVVVVDFWATWCGPCMAEAPHMVELNKKYADLGVQIIGVSLDTERGEMLNVAKNNGLTWPHVFGGRGWESPLAKQWGVPSIPCTFVLSPEGEVLWRGHPARLENALQAAIAQYPPGATPPTASESPAPTSPAPTATPAVAARAPEAKGTAGPPAAKSAAPALATTIDLAHPAAALAAAKKLRPDDPATAYATFKAIVKSSPTSPEAKSAATEVAAMEQDAAVSKKVMSAPAEAKPLAALSMAKNLQAAGQTDKARQRYEQVVKDYPDTMCAAVAKQRLDEIAKALPAK